MTKRETAAEIEAQAVRWVVLVDRGDLPPEGHAEFETWLGSDPRRQGAYMRAAAAWSSLDRAQALGAGARPPRKASAILTRRTAFAAFGAAAAAACAGVVVGPRLLGERYATALGEVRRIPLADGSVATINTSTALDVSLGRTLRRIKLDRGEAWFQVAKAPDKPFMVESGAVRVLAVGTAFSVRRRDGGSDVLVTEGVVEVWSQAMPDRRLSLTAGQRTFVSNSAGATRAATVGPDITRNLAWREGQIILEGEPFAEAVAEFNRYNARKIVIADEGLKGERLVGWFRTNDPAGFAAAAAASLGAMVRVSEDTIFVHAGDKRGHG